MIGGEPRWRVGGALLGCAAAAAVLLVVVVGGGGGQRWAALEQRPPYYAGVWEGQGKRSATPTWEWTDDNLDVFLKECAGGNQNACATVVASDEALARLNQRKHAWRDASSADEGRLVGQDSAFLARPERYRLFPEWDVTVPLAEPVVQGEFAFGGVGGDAGNTLVPAAQVSQRQELALAVPWRGQRNMYVVAGEELIDSCCLPHKPAAAPKAQVGRKDAAEGGNGGAKQGKGKKCAPGGPLCGPTRPSVDYGEDIDLTKGWLGEVNPKPCCPCLGKGARVINYADYPGAGWYNMYTMELCRNCGDCTEP